VTAFMVSLSNHAVPAEAAETASLEHASQELRSGTAPVRCAVKAHFHQRVEIPPEELSMHLGSYRARSWSQESTVSKPRDKGLERRSSKHAGRNLN
jgi:hypothetical protein